MGDFHKLRVWQDAHGLTLSVYRVTKVFPKEEVYGITSQMRRAASSITANIAEGCGRRGDREFLRYLRIALGSANELEDHIILASDLEYMTPEDRVRLKAEVTVVQRMIAKLINRLSQQPIANSH